MTSNHPERKWYVIHTYSGYESKVKANLEKRIASMNMGEKIFRIVVPVEEEVELKKEETEGKKGSKRKVTRRKVFPGYVLVEMIMADDSWYVVRNTPGVTGFVGSGNKPIPLTDQEVRQIMKQMGLEEPRVKIDLVPGDKVKVVGGPFAGNEGQVLEVLPEKGKVKVMLVIFGRETGVVLDHDQLERL